MSNLSDAEILSLWKDINFTGSFSGVKNFQSCLKHEKNIEISANRIREVLRHNVTYASHIQARLRGKRRSYHVHGPFAR